jgi:hypothetical protein
MPRAILFVHLLLQVAKKILPVTMPLRLALLPWVAVNNRLVRPMRDIYLTAPRINGLFAYRAYDTLEPLLGLDPHIA